LRESSSSARDYIKVVGMMGTQLGMLRRTIGGCKPLFEVGKSSLGQRGPYFMKILHYRESKCIFGLISITS